MNNVLVIGGAGFVGSALCEELLKTANSVWSYDNYFTGRRTNHVSGVNYLEGHTRDINSKLFPVMFSHVYHLGEYSRVEQSFEDIDYVFEYNTASIYSVLRFVKVNGAKIIYSGSSTKYGDDGECGFSSPYAWTKKTNAELVQVYCDWFSIPFAITYFYNVYGGNELSSGKYATLIAIYIEKIKSGVTKLPVVKPGTQSRNFTHISDIVSGLIAVGTKGHGDEFGIGSDESYSIIDVVSMLGGEPSFLEERRGNRMSAPVISHNTKKLGWKPVKRLSDYLEQVVNKT